MHRRTLLGAAVAIGSAGLAGCSGASCRAETPIGDKAEAPMEYASDDDLQVIRVEGRVESAGRDWLVLDDGTGTAALSSGPFEEWIPANVDQGSCLRGGGSYLESMQAGHDADVVLFDTYVDR